MNNLKILENFSLMEKAIMQSARISGTDKGIFLDGLPSLGLVKITSGKNTMAQFLQCFFILYNDLLPVDFRRYTKKVSDKEFDENVKVKYRTLGDIYLLCKNYFPSCSLLTVAHQLHLLVKDGIVGTFRCSGIHKRVYFLKIISHMFDDYSGYRNNTSEWDYIWGGEGSFYAFLKELEKMKEPEIKALQNLQHANTIKPDSHEQTTFSAERVVGTVGQTQA